MTNLLRLIDLLYAAMAAPFCFLLESVGAVIAAFLFQKFNFFEIQKLYYNYMMREFALKAKSFFFWKGNFEGEAKNYFMIKAKAIFCAGFLFVSFVAFSHSQTQIFISSSNFSQKMESEDFKERRAATEYLSKSNLKNKKELLKKALGDKDPIIREKASIALGKTKDAGVMNLLIDNLKSKDDTLRVSAIEGLGEFPKNRKAALAVIGMLSHKDRNTKWKAVEVLGKMKNDLAVDALNKLAEEEKDEYVKKSCIESLYKIGSKKAVLALKELEKSQDEKVSKWAGNVLKIVSIEKKGVRGKR